MSQPRTVLTSSQVAEKLGKSKRTIQRMADKGELEAFGKLPGSNGAYLFDPEVVEEYLKPAEITAERGALRAVEGLKQRRMPRPLTIRNPRAAVRTGTDS